MKKLFTLIIVCLTTISTWAYDVEVDGICYNLITKAKQANVTYKTTGFGDYTNNTIIIPSYITVDQVEYKVSSIGDYAFRGCGITSITLPNTITKIGEESFSKCSQLTLVTIPDSVKNIGYNAFVWCM